MIPGIIVEFLERASVAVAATRDRNLAPAVHRVSAWQVSDDHKEITCLIAADSTDHLLSSLEDNGEFALTVEQIGPHETYQFKGKFIDSRPVRESDQAVYERCRQNFVEACLPRFGISEEALRRFIPEPALAVRFQVHDIFVQTPGPSAGRRLVRLEE